MMLEFKLLFKQRAVWLLILLSLVLTYLSLQNGWQNIEHIRDEIQHAQHDEQQRKQAHQAAYPDHGGAGEMGYYLFHNVYQHPTDWSFIALGNRMVTPYVQRIRLLGLQGQLYDGESHHPEYVMMGSFDYAFWLIFFAPLLCIALLHDLKASEHQAQRLIFLRSLLNRPSRFWLKRVAVRWSIIAFSLCLPLIMFSLWHALPLVPLLIVLAVTLSYTLFWSLICVLVSLRASALNASFNAMLLASLWLLICMVLPNFAQAWLHYQYPVQDGSDIALQHRQLVHGAWDIPKQATLQPFYQLYPQWQDTAPVTDRFHWKWYYAFQHMADVKISALVENREQALLARSSATENIALMLPSLWAEQKLENVAESNIQHLLIYRQQVVDFHTQLRHYIYPYLFNETPFNQEDFAGMPTFDDKAHHGAATVN
jgi:ABC-2 type transport system permease protein